MSALYMSYLCCQTLCNVVRGTLHFRGRREKAENDFAIAREVQRGRGVAGSFQGAGLVLRKLQETPRP